MLTSRELVCELSSLYHQNDYDFLYPFDLLYQEIPDHIRLLLDNTSIPGLYYEKLMGESIDKFDDYVKLEALHLLNSLEKKQDN